jgi:cytochrome P450
MAVEVEDPMRSIPLPGGWFLSPFRWADMDRWHREVAEIRRNTPVLEVDVPGYEKMWVLTRHRDVFAVSRDNDRWHNTVRSVVGPDAQYEQMMTTGLPMPKSLVHIDGADHRDHRAVTNDWFKPAAVGRRQPRIDQIADEFVERMRSMGGRCDFAADIAQPFTLRVIMDIYGVPESDESMMLELTQGIFGAADPEYLGDAADPFTKVLESVMRFIAYFNEITEDRRACPADDIATVIVNGMPGGCPIDDEHRLWYFIIIATAGHDTTSFALSGGMEALARDPEQFHALGDDPDLLVGAADEIIRWTSPVRHFMRYAQEDSEVGGVEIPAGGRVLLSYPAANRDEEVFRDPDVFDVRRSDSDKLISFGVGAHFCLGAQFARREVRTLIGRLSRELDHVELDGEPLYAQSHFVSGVKHLPISYRFR